MQELAVGASSSVLVSGARITIDGEEIEVGRTSDGVILGDVVTTYVTQMLILRAP